MVPNVRALILDMDGVLWRANQPIGNLASIFSLISRNGWKFLLATNNATQTVEQYLLKLKSLGVEVAPWQILTSAQVAAQYLHRQFPLGGGVFGIGEAGLFQSLEEHGFDQQERDIVAVIASLDRDLTYQKLKTAALHIRAGTAFLATNNDRTLPTPEGLVPGSGSIVAALEAATDCKAIVVGKPEPELFRQALARLNTLPEETMMVGDRLETDIAGAQRVGIRTGIVLSGVTDDLAARQWSPPADLIAPDLAHLARSLAK